MSLIIWLVGALCCIWCIKDVFSKTSLSTLLKIVISVALICCSWIGLGVYYFILRKAIK